MYIPELPGNTGFQSFIGNPAQDVARGAGSDGSFTSATTRDWFSNEAAEGQAHLHPSSSIFIHLHPSSLVMII